MKDLDVFIVLAVGALILTIMRLTHFNVKIPLKKNEVLICYIKSIDSYSVIDRNKIVEYDPDTGYWIFTNGYAKNCYIEKE